MSRNTTFAGNNSRTLAFIGHGQYDLYLDRHNMLWSVPKNTHHDRTETCLGDRHNLLTLQRKGRLIGYTATLAGRELLDTPSRTFRRHAAMRSVVHAVPAC